ncbi:MAG: arylamine N-acetyltransferase family protein [Gammaproteobacteria bacterium]
MSFEIEHYLDRIGISHPRSGAEGLAELQEAQQRAIAFENIDPYLGLIPPLDLASIVDKHIRRRRGGYCLELNGLFEQALKALDYNPVPVLARVRLGNAEGGPRAHLAFLVEAEGETWLADAGFGGPGPAKPLLLSTEDNQIQGHSTYRIRYDGHGCESVVEKRTADGWFSLYGFDRANVRSCDLDVANLYCSTAQESPFPFHLMMNRVTEYGRISLFDKTLTETRLALQVSREIETFGELEQAIRSDFGIEIGMEKLEAIAERLDLLHDPNVPV